MSTTIEGRFNADFSLAQDFSPVVEGKRSVNRFNGFSAGVKTVETVCAGAHNFHRVETRC